MTIDEAVALYRKGRIATFTFEPDSIDMSYVERDVAEFRKGWVACVLNYDDASKDRISQLESEIAELRKDRKRLNVILDESVIVESDPSGGYFSVTMLSPDPIYGRRKRWVSPTVNSKREAIDAAIAAVELKGGDGATSNDR